MKKYKIALFASHLPGLEIAKFFAENSKEYSVEALYLTDLEDDALQSSTINQLGIVSSRIFRRKKILENLEHIEWFKDSKFDAIICVYWPWLLEEEIFSSVSTTVNFHPALLPINRGWYPHVHSIIDGSPLGVTLHQISSGADEGDVWAQKQIPITPTDTAGSIYLRLQFEIVELFKAKWPEIISGELIATEQEHSSAVYHAKSEIEELDQIDMEKIQTVAETINLLRARSFGNRGFAYFNADGERVYLKLSLSYSPIFDS